MPDDIVDYLAARAAIDFAQAVLAATLGLGDWLDVDALLLSVGQAVAAHISGAEHEQDYYGPRQTSHGARPDKDNNLHEVIGNA